MCNVDSFRSPDSFCSSVFLNIFVLHVCNRLITFRVCYLMLLGPMLVYLRFQNNLIVCMLVCNAIVPDNMSVIFAQQYILESDGRTKGHSSVNLTKR